MRQGCETRLPVYKLELIIHVSTDNSVGDKQTLIFAIMKTQGQHLNIPRNQFCQARLLLVKKPHHYELLLAVITNPIHSETSRLVSFLSIPFFSCTNIKERLKVFGSRLSGRTHILGGGGGE